MKWSTSFFVIACLACTPLTFANESSNHALVTDRPDAAESSETIGKLRFQLETSFAFSQDKASGITIRDYNFPTLLRFGVLEWLELRAEGEMLQIETQSGSSAQTGFTDLAVGAKAHLQDNDGLAPSLGLLAHASLPTGRNSFSSHVVEPILKVLMDWELPLDFTLGFNLGTDLPVRDAFNDKFVRLLYAAAVGHSLPWISDQLRIFAEGAGAIPLTSGKASEHTFDAGLAFCITTNIQIDTVLQVGLTDASPDFTAGLGFSMRF